MRPDQSGFSELFEGVTPNAEPVIKSVVPTFEPGDLVAESSSGITDVVELIAEMLVELRAYPAFFSRLLSYSGDEQLANVAEARVTIGDGDEVRIVSTGTDDKRAT